MSTDTEEQAATSEDVARRDVPKLVRMARQMRETSTSHQARSAETNHEPSESPVTGDDAQAPQRHHARREHLEHPDASESEPASGGRTFPILAGAALIGAVVGGYLYLAPGDSPNGDGISGANSAASASVAAPAQTGEIQSPDEPPVDSAELQRQREAALAEARAQEEARLAAELEARRQAEQERLTAELEAAKETERQRLQAELEQQRQTEQARIAAELEAARQAEQRRLQAELEASKRAEQARLAAELEASKRAEQQRIKAELAAKKKAEEERLAAELAAAKQAAEARRAAEVANATAPVSPTEPAPAKGDAKFSADPCSGPSAKFLSTCR